MLKEETKIKLKNKIKLWSKLILNWRFLVCFGLAWMITNGWSYIMLIIGLASKIKWLSGIALGYITILWIPVTPEKIITIAISLFLVKVLFPKHNQALKDDILKASTKDDNINDDKKEN